MVINDYRQATVRSDLNRITISFGEILYYTGLVLWLMQFYITRTIYADFYSGKLMTAVRYFCMLIFMVKILLTEKSVNRRVIEVILAAAAVFIVVQRNVNTGMPLIQVLLLIYGAKDISFRKICKVMLWQGIPELQLCLVPGDLFQQYPVLLYVRLYGSGPTRRGWQLR